MRRVLRLVPALLCGIALTLAIFALRPLLLPVGWDKLERAVHATPYVLLYSANFLRAFGGDAGAFGHTWSLAIEEQFYLVWPALVLVLLGRRRSGTLLAKRLFWVSAVGWAISVMSRGVLLSWGEQAIPLAYNFTLTHCDGILLGCGLASARRAWSWRLSPRLAGLAALPLVALLACVVFGSYHSPLSHAVGTVLATLSTGFLIEVVVLERPAPLAASFRSPFLSATGKRSYGLYLYHWPIFLGLGIGRGEWALAAIGTGLAFLVAWISFVWVEQPFLRWKDRWRSDRTRSPHEAVEIRPAADLPAPLPEPGPGDPTGRFAGRGTKEPPVAERADGPRTTSNPGNRASRSRECRGRHPRPRRSSRSWPPSGKDSSSGFVPGRGTGRGPCTRAPAARPLRDRRRRLPRR